MSNNRKKYESLKARIEVIETEIDAKSIEVQSLHSDIQKSIVDIALEENMLEGTTWELKVLSSEAHLKCQDLLNEEGGKLTEFRKLVAYSRVVADRSGDDPSDTDTLYVNVTFDEEKEIELASNNNTVSLYFKQNKDILPFCKKYKLKLITNNVSKRFVDLKKQLKYLELLVHELDIRS